MKRSRSHMAACVHPHQPAQTFVPPGCRLSIMPSLRGDVGFQRSTCGQASRIQRGHVAPKECMDMGRIRQDRLEMSSARKTWPGTVVYSREHRRTRIPCPTTEEACRRSLGLNLCRLWLGSSSPPPVGKTLGSLPSVPSLASLLVTPCSFDSLPLLLIFSATHSRPGISASLPPQHPNPANRPCPLGLHIHMPSSLS